MEPDACAVRLGRPAPQLEVGSAQHLELPEEVRSDMTFVPVETLEQVIDVAMNNGQPAGGPSQQKV